MSLQQTRLCSSSQWVEQVFFGTFSKYVKKEDTLILAVSGGVDSMVLLDLVLRYHIVEKIIVAHFDHALRWSESDGDRELVANFCKEKNITFEVEKMDIAVLAKNEKQSIESVARKYRYEFLFWMAKKHSAKYTLTAHHRDDQIETAMFNLIRGTKLGGIHALSELSDFDAWLILFRPLLSTLKKEIFEYAHEKNIPFREDSSNLDTDYLRNKLRHTILPEFEVINPEYRRAISNFIGYTEELKSWIDEEVRFFLWDTMSFSVQDFEKKSSFFQKEILRYLYAQANHGTVGLSEGNIEEMRRFILTANGGTKKEIKNLRLERRGGKILYD